MYPFEPAAVTLGSFIFVLFVSCCFTAYVCVCVYFCIWDYMCVGMSTDAMTHLGFRRWFMESLFSFHIGGFWRSNSGHPPCVASAFFSLAQILALKGRPLNTGKEKDERLGQAVCCYFPSSSKRLHRSSQTQTFLQVK